MDIRELEEGLKVLDSCSSQIKWRLKPQSKRRLQTDILALCTGLRPVVMVDYGGKMPELGEQLCAVLELCQKESSIFENLRVMVIEDMVYLVHVRGLAEFVESSLNSETELYFVDLEQDPPKMILKAEKSELAMQFLSIQKLFSSVFPFDGMDNDLMRSHVKDHVASDKSTRDAPITCQSSQIIDLSSCMQDTQVTVPTLNGWLLGYPVVYLFGKDCIADAIFNLSTKSLRIFRISVCRNSTSNKGSLHEELMRHFWILKVLFINIHVSLLPNRMEYPNAKIFVS
ncbi:uncharacterized protein LOC131150974 isoform X2 [Malania oleifera]|uniref:uncharacterized protein LOC131150974 isoform X2 n=1 Tax=Malania oleifera TaxID=397392 RepID=UPI0025AE4FDD|nr:uncharacterized protein LOC131150974 isoform X2 [Malania oleifera]